MAPLMLHHIEGRHGFEHGNVDLLPFAGTQAVHQRRHDSVGGVHAADFVGDDCGHEAWLADNHALQIGQAGGGLDDVVIGWSAGIKAIVA